MFQNEWTSDLGTTELQGKKRREHRNCCWIRQHGSWIRELGEKRESRVAPGFLA